MVTRSVYDFYNRGLRRVYEDGDSTLGPPDAPAVTATTWATPQTNTTFSNGDLTAAHNTVSAWDGANTPVQRTSGKYYWEVTVDLNKVGVNVIAGGVANQAWTPSGAGAEFPGNDLNSWNYRDDGDKQTNGSNSAYGDAYQANGDVVSVALDLDRGTGAVWFAKNGVWQGGATQIEIRDGLVSNAAFTGILSSGTAWGPAMGLFDPTVVVPTITANFGATAFVHDNIRPNNYSAGFGN